MSNIKEQAVIPANIRKSLHPDFEDGIIGEALDCKYHRTLAKNGVQKLMTKPIATYKP